MILLLSEWVEFILKRPVFREILQRLRENSRNFWWRLALASRGANDYIRILNTSINYTDPFLPKISCWGNHSSRRTLFVRFSKFSSNFQITRCGILEKALTKIFLKFWPMTLLRIKEPKENNITPWSAPSMNLLIS